MKQIVDRLVSDLRWRLSRLGRDYRPSARERLAWGGIAIPFYVPLLLSFAYLLFALSVGPLMAEYWPAWISALIYGPVGILAAVCGIFWLRGRIQFNSELASYRRLLQRNERVLLVEYHKFLRRYLTRASRDPLLGGPPEVARMNDLLSRLSRILASGSFDDGRPAESTLRDEVELAEAVVTSYEELSQSEMERMDKMLPQELRDRVMELEGEFEQIDRRRRARE